VGVRSPKREKVHARNGQSLTPETGKVSRPKRAKEKRGSSVARLAPRPTFIRKDKGIVSFGCQAAIKRRDEPVLLSYH